MDIRHAISDLGGTMAGRLLTLALAGASFAEGQGLFHGFQPQVTTNDHVTLVSQSENTTINYQKTAGRSLTTITVKGGGICYGNDSAAAVTNSGKAERMSPSEIKPVTNAMQVYQDGLQKQVPPLLEQAGRDIVVANAETLLGNTQSCTTKPANDSKPVEAVLERMPGAVFVSLANPLIGVKYTQAGASGPEKLEVAYDDGRSTMTFANGKGGDKAAQARDIQTQMRSLMQGDPAKSEVPQDLVDKIHALAGVGQPTAAVAAPAVAQAPWQVGQQFTPGQNGDSGKLTVTINHGTQWMQAIRESGTITLDIRTPETQTRYTYTGSSILMQTTKDPAGINDKTPFVRQPPSLMPGFLKLDAAMAKDTSGTGLHVDRGVEDIMVSISGHIDAGFGSTPATRPIGHRPQ